MVNLIAFLLLLGRGLQSKEFSTTNGKKDKEMVNLAMATGQDL